MTQEYTIRIKKFALVAIVIIFLGSVYFGAISFFRSKLAVGGNCLDLIISFRGDWDKVQELYLKNRWLYRKLDGDKDGEACEVYKNKELLIIKNAR